MSDTKFITFQNAGQRIVHTNYWDTEQAAEGFYYLSWNAGAARLLVPDPVKLSITEMRGAKYVIISRGWWAEKDRDGLEVLFEDEGNSPFAVHLGAENTDRLVPESDQGGGFDLTVWTRGGEKLRIPAKYRVVETIPYLQPWEQH